MIVGGRNHFDDYLNIANGCISAEHAMPEQEKLLAQIRHIREAFPSISKENAAIVLQSCDCNLDKAVVMMSQDGGADILSSWNFQGKKGKNGNSKNNRKKNKRQKNHNRKKNEPEAVKNVVHESDAVNGEETRNNTETNKVSSRTDGDILPDKATVRVESPPPSPKAPISVQLESPSLSPTQLSQPMEKTRPAVKASVSSKVKEVSKKELIVIESMPRSAKDLQRSAVALSRFHTVHEEKCTDAEKSIKSQFSRMRESLMQREKFLLEELEKVKVEAANLLDERQGQAATLQMQCNAMGRLPYEEIQELRAEIKRFVGDRKVDEELATSDRFIGDCQSIIEAVASFGQINPLRADYKAKAVSIATQTSIEASPCNELNEPLDNIKTTEQKSLVEFDNKSLSSVDLKEQAEVHSRLVEAIEKQASKSAEKMPRVSHEEHSKVATDDKNVKMDVKAVVKVGTTQVKNVTKSGNSFEQLQSQNTEKRYGQRNKYLPPRHRQERQQYAPRWERKSQSAKDRYYSEWKFDSDCNDMEHNNKRFNQKRSTRPFDERPDHRHRRRMGNVQERKQSVGEERSAKDSPRIEKDAGGDKQPRVDAGKNMQQSGRENAKDNMKSNSDTQNLGSLKDENNNYSRNVKDLSKTEGKLEREIKHNGVTEREHQGKEGKSSRSHGSSHDRSKDYTHRNQDHFRENSKETLVGKASTSDSNWRRDEKKSASKGRGNEATSKLTLGREEKTREEKHSNVKEGESCDDVFVEQTIIEKADKDNCRSKQNSNGQQRGSSYKTDEYPERHQQRRGDFRRRNTRSPLQGKGENAEMHRGYNNYRSGKFKYTKHSPQRTQKRENGDESKNIRGVIESETTGYAPKQDAKPIKKSWADEVIVDVNCNGHRD